jgi:hypothetical protein
LPKSIPASIECQSPVVLLSSIANTVKCRCSSPLLRRRPLPPPPAATVTLSYCCVCTSPPHRRHHNIVCDYVNI